MTETMPVALVTGAGTGIGRAIALGLAEDGFVLGLVGRTAASLDQTRTEIVDQGGRAAVLTADLADLTQVQSAVQAVLDDFGRLDVLVNNAAALRHGPIERVTPETFDAAIAVNLRAPYFLIQAALPALRDSPRASIVNVGSSAAARYVPGQSVYAMSKAALTYLTRSLAVELAPQAIRVNAVAPGPTDTPIHARWADDVAAAYALMATEIPLGRIGTPADTAAWVRFLVSSAAGWTTGAVIPVDGGQTLRSGSRTSVTPPDR